GVYSVSNSIVDLFVLLFFGLLGSLLQYLRFEPAPLVLGLILGPMLEQNLRRGLQLYRGDYTEFVTRPISAAFLLCSALIIGWSFYGAIRKRSARRRATVSS